MVIFFDVQGNIVFGLEVFGFVVELFRVYICIIYYFVIMDEENELVSVVMVEFQGIVICSFLVKKLEL